MEVLPENLDGIKDPIPVNASQLAKHFKARNMAYLTCFRCPFHCLHHCLESATVAVIADGTMEASREPGRHQGPHSCVSLPAGQALHGAPSLHVYCRGHSSCLKRGWWSSGLLQVLPEKLDMTKGQTPDDF